MRSRAALGVVVGLAVAMASGCTSSPAQTSASGADPAVAHFEDRARPATVSVVWEGDEVVVVGVIAEADLAVLDAGWGRASTRRPPFDASGLLGDPGTEVLPTPVVAVLTTSLPLLIATLPGGEAVLAAGSTEIDVRLVAPDATTAQAVRERLVGTAGLGAIVVDVTPGATARFELGWDLAGGRTASGAAPIRVAAALDRFGATMSLDPSLAYVPTMSETVVAVDELIDDGTLVVGTLAVIGDRITLDARTPSVEALAVATAALPSSLASGVRVLDPVALELALAERSPADRIGFVEGSAVLLDDAATSGALDELARLLVGLPEARLVVAGHTDDRGNDAANAAFSQRQAEAVVEALVDRGIAADRLLAEGVGEVEPLADNATAAGRAANRRIEVRAAAEPAT